VEPGARTKERNLYHRLNWGREVDALKAATMPVHSNRAHMACAVSAVNYRAISTYSTLAEEPPIADRLREGGHFDTGRRLRCTSDQ